MSEITLKASKRTEFKRSISRQLRNKGLIPGIVYSRGEENIAIKANELDLRSIVFTSESHIINLQIEGENKPVNCVLKDTQFDPISGRIIHFDLLGIKEDEKINIEVSVLLKGNAPGVKEGGLLQHVLHKLQVECLPKYIPSHIEVDISNLNIGDSVKVADIKLEGIEILNDENAAIVAVVPPTVVQEETAAAATETAAEGETAEPEVISKGKKEESE